jgi:hypothetical protein
MWALSATWRADEVGRPGSVWSHTLLVEWSAISGLSGGGLAAALRRPKGPSDVASYRRPIEVTDEAVDVSRTPRSLIEAVLTGLYTSDMQPHAVIAANLRDAESALLAAWDQQWAESRRVSRFATHTRIESDDGSSLQVALGPGRGRPSVQIVGPETVPSFIYVLASDIVRPSGLRLFLRRYGPALKSLVDIGSLVEAQQKLTRADTDALQFLAQCFPAPEEMEELKFDAVAPNSPLWPIPEGDRVVAAISSAPHIPADRLDLGRRLAQLWPETRGDFLVGLRLAEGQRSPALVDSILETVASAASPAMIRDIARADVDAAVALVGRNPSLLDDPATWADPEPWQAALLGNARLDDPETLASAMVLSRNFGLVALAIDTDRLAPHNVGQVVVRGGPTRSAITAYRSVFEKRPERAVESCTAPTATTDERLVAALSLPPRNAVVDMYPEELAKGLERLDPSSQIDLATRLAISRAPDQLPPEVMAVIFPLLHRATVNQRLPAKDWKLLDPVLPSGNHWDRAERLRKWLAKAIKNHNWSESEIADTLKRAGPEAERFRELLGKKSDLAKVVDSILDTVSFWS